MPIVDAHPHIYSPDRDTYPTIVEPWEPGEPASAEDLKKTMDVVGVDRAVFIQTGTFYGFDNRYVMESAKKHSGWACGVVTLNPDDPSHVELLEEAVTDSNIRGMRGIPDSINRISSPNVYRLWSKAMELGIPVNCMVMDDLERVPEIERIAQDLGDLKIVIDHCFLLNTRQKTEATLAALERLAKLPNTYAKLTCGTHGSYRVYPFVDMHAPLKRVISAFGPDRCLWGSNFPNALWSKGAMYAQNLHLFVKELGLGLPEKAAILGVTSMSLWFPEVFAAEASKAAEQKRRTALEAARAVSVDEDDEDDDSAQADERAAEVSNVVEILLREKTTSAKPATRKKPSIDEADLAALLDVTNQLDAMLGKVDTLAADIDEVNSTTPAENLDEDSITDEGMDVEDPLAAAFADFDDEEDEDEDGGAGGQPATDISALLAKQNYTPLNTEHIGLSDDNKDEDEADTDSDEEEEFDLSILMDVANQLNSALDGPTEDDDDRASA